MPYNYNASAVDYDLVPEGTHEFFIESITEKYSKKGRHMVEICLKPSDIAMQKFGKVWHYIMLDNEFSETNVGRLLAAIGIDPGRPGSIEFSEFKDEYLTAVIKHQDDDMYGAKAVVKRLLPSFSKDNREEPPLGHDSAPMSTGEARERIRGSKNGRFEPEKMPQDEYTGNDPASDDIPF
jgi:hypothetical protein